MCVFKMGWKMSWGVQIFKMGVEIGREVLKSDKGGKSRVLWKKLPSVEKLKQKEY